MIIFRPGIADRFNVALVIVTRIAAAFGMSTLLAIAIFVIRSSLASAETTNEYRVYRWQELTGQCAENHDLACQAADVVKNDLEKRGCVHRGGEGPGYWVCDVPGAGTGGAAPVELKTCTQFSTKEIGEKITVGGSILHQATIEEEEGQPPHKYMVVLLDDPICPRIPIQPKNTPNWR